MPEMKPDNPRSSHFAAGAGPAHPIASKHGPDPSCKRCAGRGFSVRRIGDEQHVDDCPKCVKNPLSY